jgi:hypothetical protein
VVLRKALVDTRATGCKTQQLSLYEGTFRKAASRDLYDPKRNGGKQDDFKTGLTKLSCEDVNLRVLRLARD